MSYKTNFDNTILQKSESVGEIKEQIDEIFNFLHTIKDKLLQKKYIEDYLMIPVINRDIVRRAFTVCGNVYNRKNRRDRDQGIFESIHAFSDKSRYSREQLIISSMNNNYPEWAHNLDKLLGLVDNEQITEYIILIIGHVVTWGLYNFNDFNDFFEQTIQKCFDHSPHLQYKFFTCWCNLTVYFSKKQLMNSVPNLFVFMRIIYSQIMNMQHIKVKNKFQEKCEMLYILNCLSNICDVIIDIEQKINEDCFLTENIEILDRCFEKVKCYVSLFQKTKNWIDLVYSIENNEKCKIVSLRLSAALKRNKLISYKVLEYIL